MDIIHKWDSCDLNWSARKQLIESLINEYEVIGSDGTKTTNNLKLTEDFGSCLILFISRLFKCLMRTVANDESCSLIVYILVLFLTSSSGSACIEEFITIEELLSLRNVLGKIYIFITLKEVICVCIQRNIP